MKDGNGCMKTKAEILTLLSREKEELERTFRVRSIALFGSYSRGEQTEESDLDILVDVDPSVGLDFVTLAEKLETLTGIPVELVSRRAINSRHMKFIADELIYV